LFSVRPGYAVFYETTALKFPIFRFVPPTHGRFRISFCHGSLEQHSLKPALPGKNMVRLITTGICFALLAACALSDVNAYQQTSGFPSRLPGTWKTDGDFPASQFIRSLGFNQKQSRKSSDRQPTPSSAKRVSKTQQRTIAADQSWFGTVMSFPAAPETNVGNKTTPFKSVSVQRPVATEPTQASSSEADFSPAQTSVFEPASPNNAPNAIPIVVRNPEAVISTMLVGSSVLIQGESSEYKIEISNPSKRLVTDIVVQLHLPETMIITNLDRPAWVNDDERTVSWELESLGAGQVETIKYQFMALDSQEIVQKIRLGMEGIFQGSLRANAAVQSSRKVESIARGQAPLESTSTIETPAGSVNKSVVEFEAPSTR
jgi:hypothetical protein